MKRELQIMSIRMPGFSTVESGVVLVSQLLPFCMTNMHSMSESLHGRVEKASGLGDHDNFL